MFDPSRTASRGVLRAFRLLPLLERYYAKAKKDGRALRRRALTREFETTL
ncbi:MAG: hypothetical protein M3R38_09520 [Actinomycetota bacterium]|nr:hypothetical protein [Actinomycetota bacterium]